MLINSTIKARWADFNVPGNKIIVLYLSIHTHFRAFLLKLGTIGIGIPPLPLKETGAQSQF